MLCYQSKYGNNYTYLRTYIVSEGYSTIHIWVKIYKYDGNCFDESLLDATVISSVN